jgi:hypothetical protein
VPDRALICGVLKYRGLAIRLQTGPAGRVRNLNGYPWIAGFD